MKYLQVCHALYDYQARTPDEITIVENNILYIINMDDDDWWKAEIKQLSSEHTGPIGLVPATYLEEVSPIGKVRAEYDYDAQQEEEISFGEGQELWLLEQDDPDWYLVKLENGDIGLAPSNHVQSIDAATNQQQKHMENIAATELASASAPSPAPPNIVPAPLNTTSPASVQQSIQNQQAAKDIRDEAQSWTVHEYDVAKKKKRKGKGNLLVGNGMLCYGSETDKTSPVQQYPILDVSKYLLNGKNLHIETDGRNPAVLDLQASSKSEAKAILVKMTDSRKTAQLVATHISQQGPTTPINSNNSIAGSTNNTKGAATGEPRWATSLYPFEAEGGEEISIGENEQILVTDYDRDDGWWRVTIMDGKSGILPSSYIQFHDDGDGGAVKNQGQVPGTIAMGDDGVDSAASDEVEAYMQRQQEQQLSDQRKEEQKRKMDQQARDEQERERRRRVKEAAQFAEATRQQHMVDERMRRESGTRSSTMPPNTSNDLSCSTSTRQNLPKPDPDRLRTWTDRSGSFRVEAQFLGYTNGKLRLHKANGVKIDVPLEKMSAEDIRWVERRTDQPVGSITKKLNQEKTPEMPSRPNPSDEQCAKGGSAKGRKLTSNSHWDWFDWFMKIGIPMQEALVYSSAFKADNLDDDDLTRMTHKQMKTLGMKEKHVQRMERYIDTGNMEPPSDGEENNNTRQNDVTRQKQVETDEEMARRLEKSWNESGGNKESSSSSSTRVKLSESSQKELHPDLLDFLGSGTSPIKNEHPIQNTSGGHSDLIGFSDDAWAPRLVKDIDQSQNQQAILPQQTHHIQKIDQHVVSSPIGMTSQQSPSVSSPTYPQTTTAPSTSAQPTTSTTLLQQSKSIDPTLLQWQSSSSSGEVPQSGNHHKLSLNQLSQQEQLRKHQQQQRQQSLLDQQQQIIMQQQQQIQQQQIHQQQVQLQQQQQNQLLQQTTGYQQPNHVNSLITHNQGFAAAAAPQMAGYIQQDQITGYIPQQPQQQLQPTGGQPMYQHQQLPTQAIATTGRDWNFSTPDNPFGSPPLAAVGPQMTGGVQFSTPNLNAFTQSPMQPSSSPAYLQQLQPQMTGIQQTELSGARDKYAAFRAPTTDVFTQSGSMQHGQSGFPQNTQQYGQPW